MIDKKKKKVTQRDSEESAGLKLDRIQLQEGRLRP